MHCGDLTFFHPFAEIAKTGHRVPHWQQPGATYFVTFRLGDSIPTTKRETWEASREAWLQHHPQPWSSAEDEEYHRRFSQQMDRWLDAGYGSCLLRVPAIRDVIEEALGRFDGDRWWHHCWVVMPNHVHCLTSLRPEWTPGESAA